MGRGLSVKEKEKIIKVWKDKKYPTLFGVAQQTRHNRDTVRRVLRENNIEYLRTNNREDAREIKDRIQVLQDVVAPKLIDNYRFNGDAIITADYHVPCVDLEMVQYVIEEGRRLKIKRLFIVGDFFNLDVLSYFVRRMGGDDKAIKMKDEERMGIEVLQMLEKQFDNIIYSMGNHEARFHRSVLDAWTFEIVLNWLKQPCLKFINTYWFYINNIRITHPKSYSQVKLSVVQRLCDKFNCDVISAHGHFSSMGYNRGGHRAVDLGCMADWERIAYMTKADTTHPRWNNGFCVIKDNQIYLRARGYGLPQTPSLK